MLHPKIRFFPAQVARIAFAIDYLRAGDEVMATLFRQGRVLMHPFVRGEISLGHLRAHKRTLQALETMTRTKTASELEVYHLIETANLAGSGIGYVDCHLLTAACLSPGTTIWTRDRRLKEATQRLNVEASIVN